VFRKTQVLRGDEARDAMADMGIDYDALTADPNEIKLPFPPWILYVGILLLVFGSILVANFLG
jgi:hypothetical protein